MNNQSEVRNVQTCTIHDMPVILFDQNQSKQCSICIQLMGGNKDFQQELLSFIDKENRKREQILGELKKFKNDLLTQSDIIYFGIRKTCQIIEQEIGYQSSFIPDFNFEKIGFNYQDSFIGLKNQIQNHYQTIQKFNDVVLEQFESVKRQLVQMNNSLEKWKQYTSEQQHSLQYELILKSTRKVSNQCNIFAVDKERNLLIRASGKEIVLYQFIKNSIIKEIQRLLTHTQAVTTLKFMETRSAFISGGEDNLIVIWELDKKNKLMTQYKLEDHTNSVNYLIISGGYDQTIKFWILELGWYSKKYVCQLSINTSKIVADLCLNEKGNQIVSCGEEQIFIIERDLKNIWNISQKIDLNKCALRVLFLNQNTFVLQVEKSDALQIYYFDQNQKKFQKDHQSIIIENFIEEIYDFCQFLKELNILAVKNGQFLNLYKQNSNVVGFQFKKFNSKTYHHQLVNSQMMVRPQLHGIVIQKRLK